MNVVAPERSGHTAVVHAGFLYVWGGYVAIDDNEDFLPSDEIWLYDTESGIWVTHRMGGELPPPMSGSCGCSLGGHMYIFGGCDDHGHTNQMYCVNLLDGRYAWRKVRSSRGTPPTARDKLSCWVYMGRLVYFGGYGHKQLREINYSSSFIIDEPSWVEEEFWGWNNEVHVYEPIANTWSQPPTQGEAPAPRAAHASATVGKRGYVCGGRVVDTRTSDIHCLDLETWTWTEVVPTSAVPKGRSWHTLTAVSDSTLFLFGGLSSSCEPLSDGWIFNIHTREWRELDHPHRNKPRLWHTACLGHNSDVIVFGGSQDYILQVDKGHCNDVLVFQTQPYSLKSLGSVVSPAASHLWGPGFKPHLGTMCVKFAGSPCVAAGFSADVPVSPRSTKQIARRLCEDYIGKNVRMLQAQLALLPAKLRKIIQKRISFFRAAAQSLDRKLSA